MIQQALYWLKHLPVRSIIIVLDICSEFELTTQKNPYEPCQHNVDYPKVDPFLNKRGTVAPTLCFTVSWEKLAYSMLGLPNKARLCVREITEDVWLSFKRN